jgi:hypothetical protein
VCFNRGVTSAQRAPRVRRAPEDCERPDDRDSGVALSQWTGPCKDSVGEGGGAWMADERWRQSVKNRKYRQRKKAGKIRLLSEGDSWFGYPIYKNIIDFIDDSGRYAIRRFEQSGDTLAQILSDAAFYPTLDSILSADRFSALIDQEEPRCLLFDGGGNDLTVGGWPGKLFVPPVDPIGINTTAWNAKLSELMNGYRKLLTLVADRVPVLVHGYDYMVASGKAVRYGGVPVTGPWFRPAMVAAGITSDAAQKTVVRRLIGDFNDGLIALAASVNSAKPRKVLYHADFRDTLSDDDWANEMHPYSRGFEKLAKKYLGHLENEVLVDWP